MISRLESDESATRRSFSMLGLGKPSFSPSSNNATIVEIVGTTNEPCFAAYSAVSWSIKVPCSMDLTPNAAARRTASFGWQWAATYDPARWLHPPRRESRLLNTGIDREDRWETQLLPKP